VKQAANRAALLDAGFLLGFLLDPEDGAMLLQNVDFEWTTWHYNPVDKTLHSHCYENLKSNEESVDYPKHFITSEKPCEKRSSSLHFKQS
jgi:hypothetical protein